MAIGEVRLELGGAERDLRFRLLAWAALEDQGYLLQDVLDQIQAGKISFKALQVLIWAMCQHQKPAPSMGDIGEWVGMDNCEEIIAKVGEAIRDASPDPPDPPAARPAPTGAGPAPDSSPVDSG